MVGRATTRLSEATLNPPPRLAKRWSPKLQLWTLLWTLLFRPTRNERNTPTKIRTTGPGLF